jgi:hypothetical protein
MRLCLYKKIRTDFSFMEKFLVISLDGKYYQFLTLSWLMVQLGSPVTRAAKGAAVAIKASAKPSASASKLVIVYV